MTHPRRISADVRRVSSVGWAILLIVAGVDGIWILAGGFHLRSLFTFPTAAIPLPLAAAWFFRRIRPNLTYFVLFDSLAQLMSFGVLGIFTYLLFSDGMPLIDRYLSEIDHAMGIDWPALIAWIQRIPPVDGVLFYVYNFSVAQTLAIYFLVCYRQPERAQELIFLMMVSMVLTSIIAGIVPATTAYMFYGPGHPELRVEIPMDADLLALRNGSLRVIDLMTMEGMVGFPSYHTCMALIFIYALRGRPFLFPLGVAVNILVVISTLSAGAHYVIDLIAGAGVVVVAVLIHNVARTHRFRTPLPAAMGEIVLP